MIKSITIIFIILIGFTRCGNKEKELKEAIEKIDVISGPTTIADSTMNRMLNSIIEKGDTLAYCEAFFNHYFGDKGDKFLYYSLIMANKHNYVDAYVDVYSILGTDKYADEMSKKLALYYLVLAYEKGSKEAENILLEKYPNTSSIPKSKSIFCN